MENYFTKYHSSPIQIGNILLGGDNPIRIQSMTNTDTLDTAASVAQCIRIIEAGGDLVRLTAQGVREAENLALIRKELRKAGFMTPLIADIHFNPAAAETAARLVEKIRINPGNYTDKRASFQTIGLTEKEYDEELERIHSRLLPLINICREYGTAVRIGINHGSLSDRIMTRYGNTPEGMVQSALEFINIFRSENFGSLVLSMKSSDTSVMIRATRMLAKEMQKTGLGYPLHLGVTEAGEGEDGRIRSAAGIGALLAEGIGDTIRVSLSEDPEKEIPVARKIADIYSREISRKAPESDFTYTLPSKPEIFRRINGPLVITDFSTEKLTGEEIFLKSGFRKNNSGTIQSTDSSSDIIILNEQPDLIPDNARISIPSEKIKTTEDGVFPLYTTRDFSRKNHSDKLNIVMLKPGTDVPGTDSEIDLYIFRFYPDEDIYAADRFLKELSEKKISLNIILNPVFRDKDREDLQIRAAAILGRYVIDGLVSGICVSNTGDTDPSLMTETSFSILQCTGKRITRTVYLSCPTCGRTKFNLQEAVQKVKSATGHFKGLKIAVMGCIVNGPGEMAGADYGYVGAAPGKVHIYKGTTAVLKNVPEEDAVGELLRLIEGDLLRNT